VHRVEQLNIGIVGVVGRGSAFRAAFEGHPAAHVLAVCDIQVDRLPQAAESYGAAEMYSDYEEMLQSSELDAVVIGTPMHLHAAQSILALERDLHVLCEVTAGVSIDECRALVAAAKSSRGVYMMAENCNYTKPNVLVRELVRRGLFGEVYYAEGEYLHELKALNEITPWRRRWQTGIDGITYPTHSLGPILQWMPDQRVTRVCCEGSGHHYVDPRGDRYENQDSMVMLAKTDKGSLIKIRVDMLSSRPSALTYGLQGTRGCYESARSGLEPNKIWLAELAPNPNTWLKLESLEGEYLPDIWRNPPEAAIRAGHDGGDYFEVLDFVTSIVEGTPCPIGIHEAMDMTLPGLISQASVMQQGAWLDVPDSRLW